MVAELTDELTAEVLEYARGLARNANGSLNATAFGVAVCMMRFFGARPEVCTRFRDICFKHNIRGERLGLLYGLLASERLSRCMAIIFSIDDGVLPIDRITSALEGKSTANIPATLSSLEDLPELAIYRQDILMLDLDANLRISKATDIYGYMPSRRERRAQKSKKYTLQ